MAYSHPFFYSILVLHYETFKRREENVTISFASKAELACGLLLEKYLPDFELEMRKTFQVPLAFGKHCDFLINANTYVEYHPVNLHFEFKDRQALRELRNALRHVKKSVKQRIVEAIKDELADRYYRERKHAVDTWASQADLVVCQDPVEFYRKVIKRFGKDVPKEHVFLNEFNELKA